MLDGGHCPMSYNDNGKEVLNMLQAKEVYEMLKLNKDRIKYFKKQGIFISEYPGAGYPERDIARLKK